ncbi:MAG: YitT family protein [Lachnospiraceae bacterium]|nr:YitT family protein [Lachnospiraceae bacterium]
MGFGKMNVKKRKIHDFEMLKKYIVIALASIGYGAGIELFLDKNNLVPGGVGGLSIIINRLTEINTGTIIFSLNIPIIIIGICRLGLPVIADSIYAIIISSAAVNYLEQFEPVTNDVLMAALMGGTIVSYCLGIVLKEGATTGGSDIIVMMIKLKYPYLKTGNIFLMVDLVIVAMSAFTFEHTDNAFYSALTVVTSGVVLDQVLYGRDEARILYIVFKDSKNEEILSERLLMELHVGVTYLKGYGAYRQKDKKVIMCAVHKKLLPKAKQIVKEIDDSAFLIITSANEIIGEGYKSHYAKNL